MLPPRVPIEHNHLAGFTIIEALIALALVSIVLASIGSLVAINAQTARRLEHHIALIETARLVASGIPRAGEQLPARLAGRVSGLAWQMRTSPFHGEGLLVQGSRFIPKLIELRVRSASGEILSLETIRIQNRSGS